jgi:hypothetical protein
MGPNPPYIPAKFGEDSLKPKKVMAKKPQKLTVHNNNNKNNTDETVQEQKDISMIWRCPNNKNNNKKNTDEIIQ